MREVIQLGDTLKVAIFHFLTRSYATRTNVLSDSSDSPYQFPERLIPFMILKALQGEHLPIYGDGSNVRDEGEGLALRHGPCRAIRGSWRRSGRAWPMAWEGVTSVPICKSWIPCADCSISACPTLPTGPTDGSRRSSSTGRSTISIMPSTPTSCDPSWGGNLGKISRADCGGCWSGIWRIRPGASASWTVAIEASASCPPHEQKGHHPRGRRRHSPLSA